MQCQMIIGSANGKAIRCEHEATREEIWNDQAGFVVVNICTLCFQCLLQQSVEPTRFPHCATMDNNHPVWCPNNSY